MKRITVADNSGTRRRQKTLHIWRNDITGMEPGSTVEVRFTDDYVRNGCQKQKYRKYVVEGVKFQDEYAEKKGRHTVAMRRIEVEREGSERRCGMSEGKKEQDSYETLADIVAQIRAAAYLQNADSPKNVFRLADRIEAAGKRMMELVGHFASLCDWLIKNAGKQGLGDGIAEMVPILRFYMDKAEAVISTQKHQSEVEAAKLELNTNSKSAQVEFCNMAKMREALEAVKRVGYPHNFQREAYHIRSYCEEITAAIRKCMDALTAIEKGEG